MQAGGDGGGRCGGQGTIGKRDVGGETGGTGKREVVARRKVCCSKCIHSFTTLILVIL